MGAFRVKEFRHVAVNPPETEAQFLYRIGADDDGSGTQLAPLDHRPLSLVAADSDLPAVGVTLDDFRAYMPTHKYIFMPTGALCPKESVDGMLRPLGKQKPSKWLDLNRRVETMTWQPGADRLIDGRMMAEGGWTDRPQTTCFNLYRGPTQPLGDAAEAARWTDHLRRIYPLDADHLLAWFAHRRQYPGTKLNHALILGGSPAIGKDTILEPVKAAIGPWNFADIGPAQVVGRFNGHVKSVICRISEGRDLGDLDRFAFYEHTKTLIAAPPDVLRCDEKNVREYYVPNVTGIVITTNHKTGGLYLPADDRRHYVAWSDATQEEFDKDYWNALWGWYDHGGCGHVAAYLDTYDLTDFDPKAPPRKTPAFLAIVDSNRAPEDAELADTLDLLGWPPTVTLVDLLTKSTPSFEGFLKDRRSSRAIPHRMETAGYVTLRNDTANDGLWRLSGKRQVVYVLASLSRSDRFAAVRARVAYG